MRRFVVIGLLTGLVLIATSLALADGRDHHVFTTASHDTVAPNHNAAHHNHAATATMQVDHQRNHHKETVHGDTHLGHRFLRWFHGVLARLGYNHGGTHNATSPETAPHPANPSHGSGTTSHDRR